MNQILLQQDQILCHWSKLNGKVCIFEGFSATFFYKQSQSKTTRVKLVKKQTTPKQLASQIISRKTFTQKIYASL